MLAGGAAASRAPEDRVVFPLLVSCRDLLEEILFAVNEGFGRAALRTVRTLYECVVVARFLHLHPEKTASFLEKFNLQWAKIVQNIPAEYRPPEMHTALSAALPKYASGKMVSMTDLRWTGEDIFKMATEVGLSPLHSVAFDYASAYIHPSSVFLLSNISTSGDSEDNILRVSDGSQEAEAREAIRTSHDLILNALDLRLKYSPSDDHQDLLEQCKNDFAQIWGYRPVSFWRA